MWVFGRKEETSRRPVDRVIVVTKMTEESVVCVSQPNTAFVFGETGSKGSACFTYVGGGAGRTGNRINTRGVRVRGRSMNKIGAKSVGLSVYKLKIKRAG